MLKTTTYLISLLALATDDVIQYQRNYYNVLLKQLSRLYKTIKAIGQIDSMKMYQSQIIFSISNNIGGLIDWVFIHRDNTTA